MKHVIAVVGVGTVGFAVKKFFESIALVLTYDLRKPRCSVPMMRDLVALVNAQGPIFVCVPTPMAIDGSCDISRVELAVARIHQVVQKNPGPMRQVVVIKSTVAPSTTRRLQERYPLLDLVFNPEFLTEANPLEDFLNQKVILLSGSPAGIQQVSELYQQRLPGVAIHEVSSTTAAEMIKYFRNCYLAVKVLFANEMYDLCEVLGLSYEEVSALAGLDARIGGSHLRVPGPDAKRGVSGTCFPKDMCALIHVARTLGRPATLLESAWALNLRLRPERDWDLLKGQAVNY